MHVTELQKGIYALMTEMGDSRGDSNFGLIVGDTEAVLIDNDIRRLEEVKSLIHEVTDKPIRYVINTHDNFDHSSANTILSREGAVLISSLPCREIMAKGGRKEFQEKMASDQFLREKYNVSDLSLADITVQDTLSLHLGGRKLEVTFVGHAHTKGDLVVYLPEEGILFGGDVLFNGCHPVTRNGDTAQWMAILERLVSLNIRLTVPGHGPVTNGKGNIEILLHYFQTFRARIAELIAQKVPMEEAEMRLHLPEFENWGKKNWLPVSVKKIYSELVG